MNKNVLIKINGMQTLDESDDSVEVITVGEYYNKNGKHYIMYEEIDDDSNAVTKNLLKVWDGMVEIKKTGAVTTTMTFETEKINKTYYSTPFGNLQIEIETKSVDVAVADTNMDIDIKYSLAINKQFTMDSRIQLNIKELEQ